jgi:hypothetical protein
MPKNIDTEEEDGPLMFEEEEHLLDENVEDTGSANCR